MHYQAAWKPAKGKSRALESRGLSKVLGFWVLVLDLRVLGFLAQGGWSKVFHSRKIE